MKNKHSGYLEPELAILIFILAIIIPISYFIYYNNLQVAEIDKEILEKNGVHVSMHEAYWMTPRQFKYLVGKTPVQRTENDIKISYTK